jgi:hypothetical protein
MRSRVAVDLQINPSRGNQVVRVSLNGQPYPYDGQSVGVHSQGDSTSPYIMGTHGTTPIMNGDMGTKVQGAIVNDPSSGSGGEGMLRPWPKSITSNSRTDNGNLGLEGVATLSIDDLNQNCQICFETPISVRFLPCKHATFCRSCYDSVVARSASFEFPSLSLLLLVCSRSFNHKAHQTKPNQTPPPSPPPHLYMSLPFSPSSHTVLTAGRQSPRESHATFAAPRSTRSMM